MLGLVRQFWFRLHSAYLAWAHSYVCGQLEGQLGRAGLSQSDLGWLDGWGPFAHDFWSSSRLA